MGHRTISNTPALLLSLSLLSSAGCLTADDPVPSVAEISNNSTVLCPTGSECSFVSLVSNSPGKLTFGSANVSLCSMRYSVQATAFSDSFPVPPNTSDTIDADSGGYYVFTCSVYLNGTGLGDVVALEEGTLVP